MKMNRLKLEQQERFIEKYNRLFCENSKKFEKKNRKTFRLNKLQRHLDKYKNFFIIQNSDLLDLLNNLNSDQESFTIQHFLDLEHSVSSKSSLMLTICFTKNLLTSD